MINEPAVALDGVVKAYPERDAPAVDNLSLHIEAGEIISLLGPNGAGKTTTIEMLVGLRRPTSGLVRTLGCDPVAQRDEIRRRVSVQPQHAALFDTQTVTELMSCWASFYDNARTPDQVIAQLGLDESRAVRIAKLSGGQRQRVLVGLALISRPELLVLDEPSTGMDPNARQELWTAIRDFRSSGGTVLLSTHSMEEAEELSDRVAILCRGRLEAYAEPDVLIERHAGASEIIATLATDADLDPLQAISVSVERVAQGPRSGRVCVRTTDSDAALHVLTTRLGATNIHVRDAGLEGVFRALTGHDLEGEKAEPAKADATPPAPLAGAGSKGAR